MAKIYEDLRDQDAPDTALTKADLEYAQSIFSTITLGCPNLNCSIMVHGRLQTAHPDPIPARYLVWAKGQADGARQEDLANLIAQTMIDCFPLRKFSAFDATKTGLPYFKFYPADDHSAHEIIAAASQARQMLGADHPLITYAHENLSKTQR